MTQFYQQGGAERLAVELAEDLNKQGIHADILSMYTEDLPGVESAKQDILDRGIPAVHFLGMPIHPSGISLIPAILKLRRLIHAEQYDIVETSMTSPTLIASWGTRGTKARHIAGVHQVFCRYLHNSKQHLFLRLSLRLNRHVIFYAISEFAANCWRQFTATPTGRTKVIYNSISDDCYSTLPDKTAVYHELGIPVEANVIIYVGRLAAYKGIDTVLEGIMPILKDDKAYLFYVGQPDLSVKDSEEMIVKLQEDVSNNGLGDRVRFLGQRSDAPRLMAAADVLVHPTRTEGFGLVLAEALAVGLPVVASNVDGIPEVLAGTDSLMIPPDNPAALREAVTQILARNPEAAIEAKEKGQLRAQDFRTRKRTNNMITLFEDTLS